MKDVVEVKLLVSTDGSIRGVRLLSGEIHDLDKQADKTQGSMSRLSGWLKGLVATVLLRQLASYTQRLFDLGTAAEETASKFSTVFGPAAERLDGEIRKVANAMGLTQTEGRGLAATVGAVVQGMGLGKEASADYSAQILRLAGDLVSFSNVEGGTEQVVRALTSAITGERESLKTLGIVISEADVKARAAQQTGKNLTATFSQQEKATATLALVTERAGVAVGDLERTQDSTANTARRLSAEIREQEERFAQLNTVTFNYVLGALGDLITGNEEAGESFAERLAKGILYAVGFMSQAVTGAGRLVRAIGNLGKTVSATASGPGSPFGVFEGAATRFLNNLEVMAVGLAEFERAYAETEKRLLRARIRINTAVFNALPQKAKSSQFGRDLRAQIFGANSALATMEERAESAAGRIRDLRESIDTRGREGAFGGAFAETLAEFERFADGLDDLPPLSDALGDLTSGLADAIGEGSERAKKAREKAEKEAEQQRRREVDRAFEARALQIEQMREGTDREIAEIRLAFDERREAFRRGYGELTAEEDRLFQEAQEAREMRVVELALPKIEFREAPDQTVRQFLGTLFGEGFSDAFYERFDAAEILSVFERSYQEVMDGLRDLPEPPPLPLDAWERQLDGGLVTSIDDVDRALGALQAAFNAADTEKARAEIRALIDAYERLKGKMLEVGEVDLGAMLETGLEDALGGIAGELGTIAAGADQAARQIEQATARIADLQDQLAEADTEKERSELRASIQAQQDYIAALEETRTVAAVVLGNIGAVLGDMMIDLGKTALLTAIGIGAIKKALQSLNPIAAAAAGVALIAFGAYIKGRVANAANVSAPTGTTFSSAKTSDTTATIPVGPDRQPVAVVDGARRHGGPVLPGKRYLVGEDGPELLEVDSPGRVVPAPETRRRLQSQDRPEIVEFDRPGLVIPADLTRRMLAGVGSPGLGRTLSAGGTYAAQAAQPKPQQVQFHVTGGGGDVESFRFQTDVGELDVKLRRHRARIDRLRG